MHRRLRARCGTEHRQGTPRPYRGVARGRILQKRDRGVFGRPDGGSASPESEGGGRLTDVFASAPVLRLPEGVASAPPVPWTEPQNIGEPSPRGGNFRHASKEGSLSLACRKSSVPSSAAQEKEGLAG